MHAGQMRSRDIRLWGCGGKGTHRLFFMVIACLLMYWTGDISAETVYEYTDKHGVRYFSDTPPQTSEPVKAHEAYASQPESLIKITASKKKNGTTLTIVNQYHGPVEVDLSLPVFENMVSDPPLPKRFLVQPRSRFAAVRLEPKNPKLAWRYRSYYKYALGPPDAKHNPPSPYRLPYQGEKAFRITQAFNGSYSHHNPHSRFAVDFAMPVGTPIACAREGIVFVVQQHYAWAGVLKEYYGGRWNYVKILHPDGTMATYGHLKQYSARVEPGDSVVAGQIIAESGNTGFSSGPHLHFVIQKNSDMKCVSVPFVFMGPGGQGITPKAGMVLGSGGIWYD